MPEYFRVAELERHRARLRNFARFAAAAVVTTPTVAADLRAHMETLGRRDVPVFVSPDADVAGVRHATVGRPGP